MIGDAISHAVLPGIVIAFMISGSAAKIPMLIGAASLGLLTTFLIETFHRKAKLQSDASIGLTFTWLFAIGVIMVSAYTGQVHIDQDCVLHGEIAFIPLDTWVTDGGLNLGPTAIWLSSIVLVLILAMIFIGYKGLFLTSFDPDYAATVGIAVSFWHYLLMSAVSLTTVVSFESVGAILVVAFLIAPPATAYLLTNNFKLMMILTVLIGILSAIGGYFLAVWIDGSIAAAMSVVAGIEFLLVFLFSPSNGLVSKKFFPKPG